MGLQFLSLLLHKHYGKETIIIIDEYDTPIQQAHTCNFYSDTVTFMCNVAIPNKEIAFVYEKEVLAKTKQSGVSISIQKATFSGDFEELQSVLEQFMLQSISSLDGANESFYHGMMLGLPGFIFEFKHTKNAKEDREELAGQALNQIQEKQYDVELRTLGVASIVKIGIAFRGKMLL